MPAHGPNIFKIGCTIKDEIRIAVDHMLPEGYRMRLLTMWKIDCSKVKKSGGKTDKLRGIKRKVIGSYRHFAHEEEEDILQFTVDEFKTAIIAIDSYLINYCNATSCYPENMTPIEQDVNDNLVRYKEIEEAMSLEELWWVCELYEIVSGKLTTSKRYLINLLARHDLLADVIEILKH